MIFGNGVIKCGSDRCGVRMAADWYSPTDAKTLAKFMRPRVQVIGEDSTFGQEVETDIRYHCFHCGYGYFHMQRDHTLTCFNKNCKRSALFKWIWHEIGGNP